MDEENDTEHAARGLSAGQMALLFLAGAAVCAVFFSAGFVVGYNEKSSKAVPITEQVTDSSDIPPVITPEKPRSSSSAARAEHKEPPATAELEHPSPERPTPLSHSAESDHTPETAPRTARVMAPTKASGPSENSSADSSRALSGDGGTYMIQVAATGTKPDGDKLVKALKGLNYPAMLVTPAQSQARDNLYRIQVGPFPTKESAEKARTRLMQDGFKQPFIKH